jgi:dipeptidyl aminopeptidase/acylaminoacyl peptidase
MHMGSIGVRAVLWCVVLWAVLYAGSVAAGVRLVKPGETPRLDPDEGLVAIVVDTTSSLRDVRLRKDGRIFNAATLEWVNPGATPKLYVMPVGTYQWSRATTFFGMWYDFKDNEDTKFRVEPGVINYPGDLLMRGTYTNNANFRFSNRGLQVMDWLEETHPELFARYAFHYTGHYPDPFPVLYREAQVAAGKSGTDLSYARKPPAPGELPIPIRDLWRAGVVEGADLNPRGDMVVMALNQAKGTRFQLVDLPSGKVTMLMNGCCPIESMQWAGDDVFVVASRVDGATILHLDVFRFARDANGDRVHEHLGMSRAGVYVQVLPEDPDHVLFASRGDMNRLLVHRLGIGSQKILDRFQPMHGTRINHGVEGDRIWFADGHGRLRLVIAADGEDMVMRYGSGEDFQEILRFGLEQPFDPLLLSRDGDLIYGLSDVDRAQRDLVVFDPVQKKIVSTLFSKPGVDVVSPIVDAMRRPIGAMYYRSGHLISEYFDADVAGTTGLLNELFPGKTAVAYDRARNGDLLVWVESSTDPGGLYRVDSAARRAERLQDEAPWLQQHKFVGAEVLTVTGPGGQPIEAYLTVPPLAGRRPLVVLPHGGPVGVRDRLGFDHEVQFLASLGYAVLQVNFRGSDGYGTEFRDAGKRAHGTLIEDDIDAVLQVVEVDARIDRTRMCVVGSSYGGYSAIVSTIRWPGRFRCAVSISGVTDMLLFFTSSDGGGSARGRRALEHYVGDPVRDGDAMKRNSPVLRSREITAPLLLVHGAEDERVDYEHTRRMVRMMNLSGQRPWLVTLADEGHGFEQLDSVETAWGAIAGFLRRFLDETRAAEPPPAPKSPVGGV